MREFSKEEIAHEQSLEARPPLPLCQELSKVRAQHEHEEEILCYHTQVSQVGKPLC